MRLFEDVGKQADLIEEACRAGLQDFAAELAVEGLVRLEDDDVGTALREEQPEQQSGRATSNYTCARAGARNLLRIIHHTPASRCRCLVEYKSYHTLWSLSGTVDAVQQSRGS